MSADFTQQDPFSNPCAHMRAQYMATDGEGRRGFRGEVGGEKRRSVDESETGGNVEWL